jgi:hypothetical protein
MQNNSITTAKVTIISSFFLKYRGCVIEKGKGCFKTFSGRFSFGTLEEAIADIDKGFTAFSNAKIAN